MSDFSPDRPEAVLGQVQRLAAERATAEAELPRRFARERADLETQCAQAAAEAARRYEQEKSATEQEYASVRRAIEAQYEGEYGATQKEYREVCAEIVARFEDTERRHNEQLREAQWEATAVFEAGEHGCNREVDEIEARLSEGWRELDAIHESAVRLVQHHGYWREFADEPPPAPVPADKLWQRFGELTTSLRSLGHRLQSQGLPRLVGPIRVLGVLVALIAVIGPLLALVGDPGRWPWLVAGVGVAAAAVLLGVVADRTARQRADETYLALRKAWAEAAALRARLHEVVEAQTRRQRAARQDHLNKELRKADTRFAGTLSQLSVKMQSDLEQANGKYPAMLTEMGNRRDRQLADADRKYLSRLKGMETAHRLQAQRQTAEQTERLAALQAEQQAATQAMAQRWRDGMTAACAALQAMNAECDRLFPDWSALSVAQWRPPEAVPAAVRVGRFAFDLARLPGGVPADAALRIEPAALEVPALLPFPHRAALLLETADQTGAAMAVIQAALLRMLTALPPGKVRMTILDPLGLGEHFAAFMHLADFDEKLVTSRIWTEGPHIEQRLADLTEYMENAIQLYLRNEFPTILDYNASAGEMAEPYRVLVVAGFPANFTEAAARRLTSIVVSGARCGVFTILSYDPKQRMPRDFHLSDVAAHAVTLAWREGRFVWSPPEIGPLALDCDRLPEPQAVTDWVRTVGQKAQEAARVEVPFAAVVPEQLWSDDSRQEIEVPLGRAGARKLQFLRLGKGTAQHVLISGKTGSGKSTLLHVLVTNLALRYSPDEVELYLIDFKKGVEFKAYANGNLPHARVIAIESEREFGLSVLQCLDGELRRRGDLFRHQNVQDLRGFRAAQPAARLPRALLVVDEFQELFVEDDRIAQEAALLLDRLVRQGRAFGIHVLLGSQTLAGAYSLPRSTLGQMAVRIALQCSESDAHLILSEDNTAARLLSRPGEAIYNDANGLFEGNHPFQVVWLSDAERDQRLRQVGARAAGRSGDLPAIIFEGNAAAALGQNTLLAELLAAPAWPEPSPAPKAWLGAPVAIKPPTACELARQGGANLLMVGHHEELAVGMLSAAVVSLAAQLPPERNPRFVILNGAPADSPWADHWSQLRAALPHALSVAGVREAGDALAELAAETARRGQAGDDHAPLVCLLVCNLGRFRDLRKGDDDFGYGRLDENAPPSPSRQFGEILREGPALGIHTLVWCDSYHTVQRFFDRRGLGEFDLRVVLHMNASDSSSLIESPAASQLGIHRALLYHVAEAWQEKFCPYGPAPPDWLTAAGGQLRGRGGA